MTPDYNLSESTYQWSIRLFSTIKKLLSVNIKLHHFGDEIENGQIFLFNHFARFETFIPQYLIYQESQSYCRSVASSEFFEGDAMLASYLRRLGAVPNDHPQLFYFLAKEILRGRKVVVFPEGGMVKDRRVLDSKGRYRIYSRKARERRKHHTGAAVLGLVLDAFKTAILDAHASGDVARVDMWTKTLEVGSTESLLNAALKPTLIVPANITFYPLRVDDNLLRKGVEAFSKGVSARRTEELLVEGNILLRDTDMDIRLGRPIRPNEHWRWWERILFQRLFRQTDTLEHLFDIHHRSSRLQERNFTRAIQRRTRQIRDRYMHGMYAAVTVNLSHLAATLVMSLVDRSITEIEREEFYTRLYITIKLLQREIKVNLHRGIQAPENYRDLLRLQHKGIEQFFHTATHTGLITVVEEQIQILPKLCEEHDFDQIRIENFIMVYANEVAPIPQVKKAATQAVAMKIVPKMLAELRFNDEIRDFHWCDAYYHKKRFDEVNADVTATQSGEPYLLLPKKRNKRGVLLVHGFLASPAELKELGGRIAKLRHPALGIRLAGHGTSPADLRTRSWESWLDSVRRGYQILSAYVDEIVLVGFSTGGILSVLLAAENPAKLAGIAVINTPLRFRNKNLVFVPLVHGANRLLRWSTGADGVMPYRSHQSEHPDINYHTIPVRGLYELRRAADEIVDAATEVEVPALVIQSQRDSVVEPSSAETLIEKLASKQKQLIFVDSDRHGIASENIGGTQDLLLKFISQGLPMDYPKKVLLSD